MPERATLIDRLHVVQRGELTPARTWAYRLLAVLGALLTGGLLQI